MHLLQQLVVKCCWGKRHFGREGCEGFADAGCHLGWNSDCSLRTARTTAHSAPGLHIPFWAPSGTQQPPAGHWSIDRSRLRNSRGLISKSEIICLLQGEPKMTEVKVLHPVLVDMYLVSSTTLCACLYFLSTFYHILYAAL